MHELSVCRALLDQVLAVASQHGAARVACVRLRVGPLSGVEAALLAAAYPFAARGTCAQHARLAIVETPVRVRCRRCGAETAAEPSRLCCGACGAPDTELAGGSELLLESLELVKEGAEQATRDEDRV